MTDSTEKQVQDGKKKAHAKKARRTTSLVEQARRTAHEDASDRRSEGKAMRQQVPLAAHAEYTAASDRPDPVALLQSQDAIRIQSLVPIRYGRMVASPFSFYRGAAIVMAGDLAGTPTTGWLAQACGDAHLDNFGAFGTEQGTLVFDVNDFDETHPAPWEWDVKRLAASAVLAAREIGAKAPKAEAAVTAAAGGYRNAIRALADISVMRRWRSVVSARKLLEIGVPQVRIDKITAKALKRSSMGSFPKLTTLVDGKRVLKEKPPLVVRVTDEAERDGVKKAFGAYKNALRGELQVLLARFELTDFARKVVGVGSVGMPAYVGLFMSADGDPLFLQVKMAVESVLEPYVSVTDAYGEPGERVVVGQRLMQATSDPLLGWFGSADGASHYYVRQLLDMKVSADLTTMSPGRLIQYAYLCGKVLAHAHARTGDPALLAGYLGKSDAFEQALTSFGVAYADQTESDYAQLKQAIEDGRVTAETGV